MLAPVRLRDSDVARPSAGQALHRGRSNCAQLSRWFAPTLLIERESGRVGPALPDKK